MPFVRLHTPFAAALTALALSAPAAAAPPITLPPIKDAQLKKSMPAVSVLQPVKLGTKIRPKTIKNLVPRRHTRGDREFDGNGPDVHCRVSLRVSENGRQIFADVHFKASETKSDWSTVDEKFTVVVFTAPLGKTIASIAGPTTSTVDFLSERAGFQLLVPGEDVAKFWKQVESMTFDVLQAFTNMAAVPGSEERREAIRTFQEFADGQRDQIFHGNHVHNRVPESGPVAMMSIVGDTGGDDISTDRNGKDDTRIEAITFKDITVHYK